MWSIDINLRLSAPLSSVTNEKQNGDFPEATLSSVRLFRPQTFYTDKIEQLAC